MPLTTDVALAQIHPEARAIVLAQGPIPETNRDGVISFAGLDAPFWEKLEKTKPDAFRELVRLCQRDFPTYCALLLKVVPKGGGLIPFIFNRPQRFVWRRMVEILQAGLALFLVILKARQFGISTFFCAFQHWQAWRQSDVHGLLIAHERTLANRLVGFLRVFHEELPPNLRPSTRQVARGEKATIPKEELDYREFRGVKWRSSIGTYIAKNVEARGMQATNILESEHASYPNAVELNAALLPQLPPPNSAAYKRCSVVIESTPKGRNAFYDICKEAREHPGAPWHFLCLPWYLTKTNIL